MSFNKKRLFGTYIRTAGDGEPSIVVRSDEEELDECYKLIDQIEGMLDLADDVNDGKVATKSIRRLIHPEADGGTVEIGGQVMTEAQFNAARFPLLNPDPGEAVPEVECRAFRWIGQDWSTCDNCGRDAREHDGLEMIVEDNGPFDSRFGLVPWEEVMERGGLAALYLTPEGGGRPYRWEPLEADQ